MRFTIFQDSHQGDRSGNEDRVGYSYSKDVLLMVAADGMGGHLQGEVAAEIAVTEITRLFQQEARNRLRRPSDFLVSVINSAHRAIVSHAVAENLLESPRTTCVAVVVPVSLPGPSGSYAGKRWAVLNTSSAMPTKATRGPSWTDRCWRATPTRC